MYRIAPAAVRLVSRTGSGTGTGKRGSSTRRRTQIGTGWLNAFARRRRAPVPLTSLSLATHPVANPAGGSIWAVATLASSRFTGPGRPLALRRLAPASRRANRQTRISLSQTKCGEHRAVPLIGTARCPTSSREPPVRKPIGRPGTGSCRDRSQRFVAHSGEHAMTNLSKNTLVLAATAALTDRLRQLAPVSIRGSAHRNGRRTGTTTSRSTPSPRTRPTRAIATPTARRSGRRTGRLPASAPRATSPSSSAPTARRNGLTSRCRSTRTSRTRRPATNSATASTASGRCGVK